MKNGFFRGHGLGNDYVVMDPKELSFKLTPARSSHLRPQLGTRQRRDPCAGPVEESRLRSAHFQPGRQRSGKIRQRPPHLCPLSPCDRQDEEKAFYGGDQRRAGHDCACMWTGIGDASAVTVAMGRATFSPAALPCTLPSMS